MNIAESKRKTSARSYSVGWRNGRRGKCRRGRPNSAGRRHPPVLNVGFGLRTRGAYHRPDLVRREIEVLDVEWALGMNMVGDALPRLLEHQLDIALLQARRLVADDRNRLQHVLQRVARYRLRLALVNDGASVD